jgi:hypothetical protein
MPAANMQNNRIAFIWRGETPRRALIYAMAVALSPAVRTPVASIPFLSISPAAKASHAGWVRHPPHHRISSLPQKGKTPDDLWVAGRLCGPLPDVLPLAAGWIGKGGSSAPTALHDR